MKLAALLLFSTLTLPAQDRLMRVQQLLQHGDWTLAKQEIQSGLKETPDEPVLWNFLGIAAAQDGQWAESEKAFANALRLRPGMNSALDNQARMRMTKAAALQGEKKYAESQLTLAKLPAELRNQPDMLALQYVNELKLRRLEAAKATAASLAGRKRAQGSMRRRASRLRITQRRAAA